MRLNGKRTIVTGGAKGIGAAVVRLFCQEGARVMITDVDEAAGGALAEELTGQGRDVLFYKANVAVPEDVEQSVAAAVARFDGLDILVSNAGIIEPDNLLENVPVEIWRNVIDVNLGGMFLCAKYALPHLRKSKGCIVNTASICSLVASQYDPSYCASKGGVLSLTRAIAFDYAQYGVRCNAVAPTICDSPMIQDYTADMPDDVLKEKMRRWGGPGGRFCTPEEVAQAVLFLASPDAGYVNGIIMPVDGGYTAI